MKCKVCNNEIPYNMKFCPYCGNKLFSIDFNPQFQTSPQGNIVGLTLILNVLDTLAQQTTLQDVYIKCGNRQYSAAQRNGSVFHFSGINITQNAQIEIHYKVKRRFKENNYTSGDVEIDGTEKVSLSGISINIHAMIINEINSKIKIVYSTNPPGKISSIMLNNSPCRVGNNNDAECPYIRNLQNVIFEFTTANNNVIRVPVSIKPQHPSVNQVIYGNVNIQNNRQVNWPEGISCKVSINFDSNINTGSSNIKVHDVQNDLLLMRKNQNTIDAFVDLVQKVPRNIQSFKFTEKVNNTTVTYVKKIPTSLNLVSKEEDAILAVDFGNSRTTMGVYLKDTHALYIPQISRGGPLILDSLEIGPVNYISPHNASNSNTFLSLAENFMRSRDYDLLRTRSQSSDGLKNRVFFDIMNNNHQKQQYLQGCVIRLFTELFFRGLYALYNINNLDKKIKITEVRLAKPPTWPDAYDDFLIGSIKEALNAINIDVKGIDFYMYHESYAPTWAQKAQGGSEVDFLMVWDFGGGTTDVAIYEFNGNKGKGVLLAMASGMIGGNNIDIWAYKRHRANFVPNVIVSNDPGASIHNIKNIKEQNNGFPQNPFSNVYNDLKDVLEGAVDILGKKILTSLNNQGVQYREKTIKLIISGGSAGLKHPNLSQIVENWVKNNMAPNKLHKVILDKIDMVDGLLRIPAQVNLQKKRDIVYYDYVLPQAAGNYKFTYRKGQKVVLCTNTNNWLMVINDMFMPGLNAGSLLTFIQSIAIPRQGQIPNWRIFHNLKNGRCV